MVGPAESVNCNCEDYKKDIENLKMEIETQKRKLDDVDYLKEEFKKVSNIYSFSINFS